MTRLDVAGAPAIRLSWVSMDFDKLDKIPPVVSWMTPFPHSIDVAAPVEEARALMAEHELRHLPVMQDGRLVGIVSDRDIGSASAAPARPIPAGSPIGDVCQRDVYVVSISEPVDRVLQEMADRHIGSTLVVKDGKLVGIFTATDVCRCFAAFLRSRFPAAPDVA